MKRYLYFLVSFFVISLSFCSCGMIKNEDNTLHQFQHFVMGTYIVQNIYGKHADIAASCVYERLKVIEAEMTVNTDGGVINRLNQSAGKEWVSLGQDTLNVLTEAKHVSEYSDGAFDITVGPIIKAWGFFTGSPVVPPRDEINKLIDKVDYRDIIIDTDNTRAFLSKELQGVDLGGIAKGFAGDEAIRIYGEMGVNTAYIDLGGNVVLMGDKPDGNDWRIGVQNPRGVRGSYIGILNIRGGLCVVTSGDYERFFEQDGTRYHHIIDPATGYPAYNGLISATIIAADSMEADALSTAVFVMGLEKGMEMVEEMENTEAVLITSDYRVYVSSGVEDRFEFKDDSGKYEYIQKR